MKLRFQADADVDPDIRRGLLRREPSIDFRSAEGIIRDGTPHPEVLQIAAGDNRVLVTRDVRTMSAHFHGFIATQDSPGILLIPSSRSTGAAIAGLFGAWLVWTADDLRNQIRWLP